MTFSKPHRTGPTSPRRHVSPRSSIVSQYRYGLRQNYLSIYREFPDLFMPILNTECTPESVGLSSTRLHKIATNVIDRFVEENQIPFGQVLVARRNKICYQYQAGMINVKQASPIQNDSIFRIYSMTKPITSVTLMALQEQGCFRLTDPLGLYLPEFDKANLHVYKSGLKQLGNGKYVYNSEACSQDITIQMLMNHTSGLSYGFDKPGLINPVDRLYHAVGPGTTGQRAGRPDMPLDVFCKKLAKMPLVCQPGTQWNYSLSVDVQGRLIEVLTGKSLYEAMKDLVLDPLGMVNVESLALDVDLKDFSCFTNCRRHTCNSHVSL